MEANVMLIGDKIRLRLGASDWELFCRFISVPYALRTITGQEDQSSSGVQKHEVITHRQMQSAVTQENQKATIGVDETEKVIQHQHEQEDDSVVRSTFDDKLWSKRLMRACTLFLQCVSEFYPILLWLDDVHLADDEQCLRLIRSIVHPIAFGERSHSASSVLVVLSSREGFDAHQLVGYDDSSEESSLAPFVDVKLENFDMTQVNEFLSRILSQSQRELSIAGLGTIVLEKTRGNPLFVTQLLEHAHSLGLLEWSRANQCWECTDVAGLVRLDVSSGVVSSVEARLYQLSSMTRSIFSIAAHLGYTFRRDVLLQVVAKSPLVSRRIGRGLSNSSDRLSVAEKLVDEAVKEALGQHLLAIGHDKNKLYFMHDRVQEGFYEMVPSGLGKDRMYLNIGRSLLELLENTGMEELDNLDSILFSAVDSMNNGINQMVNEEEKMELLNWNMKAADKASRSLSFISACSYLEVSMSLLPDTSNNWDTHYNLTKQLHEKLSQAYCLSHRFESAHRLLDAILNNAVSVLDKQTASHIRCQALEMNGDDEAAFSTVIECLGELGFSVEAKPSIVMLMWRFQQVKWLLRGMKDEDLLLLPPMQDTTTRAIMQWLEKLLHYCIQNGHENLMLQSSVDMFRMCLVHGQTKWTPSAAAAFGILELGVTRNVDRACQMGEVANRMLEQFAGAVCDTSSTHLFVHMGLRPLREPIRSSIPHLEHAFEVGLQHGQIQHAIRCLSAGAMIRFHSGDPLLRVEQRCLEAVQRILEVFGKGSVALVTRCLLQAVCNLLGKCEDSARLSGDIFIEDEVQDRAFDEYGIEKTMFVLLKFQLACHFRFLRIAEQQLQLLEKNRGEILKLAWCQPMFRMFACLTYLDLAREASTWSIRRKSIRKAKRHYRILQHLAKEPRSCSAVLVKLIEA